MKKLDLARYQKSRESVVDAGPHKITIRRPSALEVARLSNTGGGVSIEFACQCVTGWANVNESDLVPGGDPEPVEFDRELFAAWITDQPALWSVIVSAVIESYQRHESAQAERGNA